MLSPTHIETRLLLVDLLKMKTYTFDKTIFNSGGGLDDYFLSVALYSNNKPWGASFLSLGDPFFFCCLRAFFFALSLTFAEPMLSFHLLLGLAEDVHIVHPRLRLIFLCWRCHDHALRLGLDPGGVMG